MIAKIRDAHNATSNDSEQEKIIRAISHTLLEIECTRNLFNNALEPELIETAIYSEEAALSRYSYLISEAKKLGITYEWMEYKDIELG